MISPLSSPPLPSLRLGQMVNVERVSAILTLRACKNLLALKVLPYTKIGLTEPRIGRIYAKGNCAFPYRLRLRLTHRIDTFSNQLNQAISARVSPIYDLSPISYSSRCCFVDIPQQQLLPYIAVKQSLWCASVALFHPPTPHAQRCVKRRRRGRQNPLVWSLFDGFKH